MRLGFIGLGSMGAAMARNLADDGHDLTVYDLDAGRVEDLARSGDRPGTSGEDVAGAVEVLFTSLPGPRQAAAAMPGLIDALRPGATWVDMTTNDRGLVLELAQRAEARQVSVLDAPVTGAIDGACRGTLTIFVGGSGPVLEQVRPYLELLGRIIVCGPLGNGTVVKLVTNQVWFINAAAIGEALVLGKKAGCRAHRAVGRAEKQRRRHLRRPARRPVDLRRSLRPVVHAGFVLQGPRSDRGP